MLQRIDLNQPTLSPREWLLTNGLGGYACGPLSGLARRRYHGWLVAALPPPLGRVMMLNRLVETAVTADGRAVTLGAGGDGDAELVDFHLDWGLPVWRFALGGLGPETVLERRATMVHGDNAIHLRWSVLDGPAATLRLTPWVQMRPHGQPVDSAPAWGRAQMVGTDLRVDCPDYPPLWLCPLSPEARVELADRHSSAYYDNEAEGGDPAAGPLWSPGHLTLPVGDSSPAWLAVGLEPARPVDPWPAEMSRRRSLVEQAHPALRDDAAAGLVLAADTFVVQPRHRQAQGDGVSVIAGYPWFADWGRDTMIALDGLLLTTGRAELAARVLNGFAAHMRDGLIPNMFPDGHTRGAYNTADATLWFFHAVDRVVAVTGDDALLARLMPALTDSLDRHIAGTRFHIGMDPADHLLIQGAPGLQLTWMDAKAGDWVVTPRRGKAVEINALWYNAVAAMADWCRRLGQDGSRWDDLAARIRQSFNTRFWAPDLGHLRDVVDGETGEDGNALRPNQVFAISLPHPVLDPAHWPAVIDAIAVTLATPCGLRSLAPDHPDYRPHYQGDRVARDGAYHQGTVWAWLIGPYAEARLKTDPAQAATIAAELGAMLTQTTTFCIGTVGEVFDAAPPHRPRGCFAQAWSVAEWLRVRGMCSERQPL